MAPHEGGAAGSASDPRAGEAGPSARALGSHTRADAQPHAVVDRQQRRYHHAACEPAFPLGAGTEAERLDTWQDPRHAQTLGRGPAPRPGRPGRAPHGVSPCGVPPAGDAVGAAAGPAPGTHHRGLSRQSRADAPRVASPALRHLVSSGVSACARWGARLAVVTCAGGPCERRAGTMRSCTSWLQPVSRPPHVCASPHASLVGCIRAHGRRSPPRSATNAMFETLCACGHGGPLNRNTSCRLSP